LLLRGCVFSLSIRVAEKLKGLFLLFAGHFISNAVMCLEQIHSQKQGEAREGGREGSESKDGTLTLSKGGMEGAVHACAQDKKDIIIPNTL
jgi:hypothetical protein